MLKECHVTDEINCSFLIISCSSLQDYCTNAEDELCKIDDRIDELCVAKSSVRSDILISEPLYGALYSRD